MKKTVKLLSLAIALFAGINGTAQAEESSKKDGFQLKVEGVSSYVWRGRELSDAPAIQPTVTYIVPGTGIVLGAWGTNGFSTNASNNKRYQETDLYITVPLGPVTLTAIDYYVPAAGATARAFDFKSDGPNTIEVNLGFEHNDLSLLAAVFVGANTSSNAKYFEAGYKFHADNGYTTKAVVGIGDKSGYSNVGGNGMSAVNLGLTVSKDRYSAAYIYNAADEKANLVLTASF